MDIVNAGIQVLVAGLLATAFVAPFIPVPMGDQAFPAVSGNVVDPDGPGLPVDTDAACPDGTSRQEECAAARPEAGWAKAPAFDGDQGDGDDEDEEDDEDDHRGDGGDEPDEDRRDKSGKGRGGGKG